MDMMAIKRMVMGQMASGGKIGTLLGTYTVPESWETDSKGNPVSIINTVLQALDLYSSNRMDHFGFYDVILFVAENNENTSAYRMDYIICAGRDNKGYVLRNGNTYRDISSNTSCYISSGASIKVYEFSLNNVY